MEIELRKHCNFAAVVNAKDRFDAPRCAGSTRMAMLQCLDDWVDESGRSDMFWLYGGAGAGKSALAQSFAERRHDARKLSASFFFSKTSAPPRTDGDKLIPTLVYQLVQAIPDLKSFVLEQIHNNMDIFEKDRKTQMDILFVMPLKTAFQANAIQVSKSPQYLVVIDGLDECNNTDIQRDLLEVIMDAMYRLPKLFRFLIASRPELHIKQILGHEAPLQAITVERCDLSSLDDADYDISIFIKKEFERICLKHQNRKYLDDWPDEDSIIALVENSSKHFIYASTVMKYIGSYKHWPPERLKEVLRLSPYNDNGPFVQLDELYSLTFRDVEKSQLEKLLRAFGILHLISEEEGYFRSIAKQSSAYSLIEKLLALESWELGLLFDPLRSLVALDTDKEDLHVLHKTLFDYLLDPSRSRDFHVKLALSHETTAVYILKNHVNKNKFCECYLDFVL